jgi:hypothetical protein
MGLSLLIEYLLRLDCGSEVTVGCAGARPVNPLKLGYTLSTLNFRIYISIRHIFHFRWKSQKLDEQNIVALTATKKKSCGSEVTVGCAGARPVNPLKLGYTLSTLNFRTCDHLHGHKFENWVLTTYSQASTGWRVEHPHIRPWPRLLETMDLFFLASL